MRSAGVPFSSASTKIVSSLMDGPRERDRPEFDRQFTITCRAQAVPHVETEPSTSLYADAAKLPVIVVKSMVAVAMA